jgi:hypothetical protein
MRRVAIARAARNLGNDEWEVTAFASGSVAARETLSASALVKTYDRHTAVFRQGARWPYRAGPRRPRRSRKVDLFCNLCVKALL